MPHRAGAAPAAAHWRASGRLKQGQQNTQEIRKLFVDEQTLYLRWTIVSALMHAVITTSCVPLFIGALLSDWAYSSSQQTQWVNFAAWLIAGGLLIAGLALLWGAVDVLRASANRHRFALGYLSLLLATFVVGFIDALVHAKDGWAAMPTGLILSAAVVVLAVAASAIGLAARSRRPP